MPARDGGAVILFDCEGTGRRGTEKSIEGYTVLMGQATQCAREIATAMEATEPSDTL